MKKIRPEVEDESLEPDPAALPYMSSFFSRQILTLKKVNEIYEYLIKHRRKNFWVKRDLYSKGLSFPFFFPFPIQRNNDTITAIK